MEDKLKVGLAPFKKKIIFFNDSPSIMMKNVFVLKIFKFLS